MSFAIVPLAILSIIIINYPILKTVIKFQDKKKIGKQCRMPILRNDLCLKSKYESCPRFGSYKQCTNNNITMNKCDCTNRSFELCTSDKQYDEKCFNRQYKKMPDVSIYPNFPKPHVRVNVRRCDTTGYNHIFPKPAIKPINCINGIKKINYLDRNTIYSQHPKCN